MILLPAIFTIQPQRPETLRHAFGPACRFGSNLLWSVLFGIPVAMGLGSCQMKGDQQPKEQNPTPVEIIEVSEREYSIPVRTTGILATREQMKLSFMTGGIVKEVQAKEGLSYKRGDMLAVLDLSEVQATVDQARIGLEKAQRDLRRARNLYQDSVATLEQYQNARSAFEVARSSLQIAEFNLKHSSIGAPADGKVQKVMVEANELIAPGHPAILYASTEDDWILRASLTDKDIVRLSLGDTARLNIDAFPDRVFAGEVSELGTVADPVTGTYEVEVRLLQNNPLFRTGFFARAEIIPAMSGRSVMVPLECVVDANDRQAVVFVYSEGSVEKRNIKTGALVDRYLVVREGLSAGEKVVSRGAHYLKAGMQVTVLNPMP